MADYGAFGPDSVTWKVWGHTTTPVLGFQRAVVVEELMGSAETPTELYKIGLGPVRYQLAVGDLLIGWQLLFHAEIALRALDSGAAGKEQAFYEGKIAAAQFFAANVLPEITATRGILARTSTALMDLDEAAF